ncbi:MAG TPA: low molecular weight protein-tyrosine-phosphatase [Pseudoxanthomonas sp.]|jgi:protein-tyrosine phosphatase|nr:low molecular weight protein-tyrosine-phosphatase [Pseudoxanthomonas sp.]
MKILIVCVGNICRSPMAEAVLRRRLPHEFAVSSAGLAARAGEGVHPVAAEVLREQGYPEQAHLARQFERAMIDDAELVLTMEQRHLRALLALAPTLRGRVHLLARWDEPNEIKDPCGRAKANFEEAFAQIDRAAHAWCARLI